MDYNDLVIHRPREPLRGSLTLYLDGLIRLLDIRESPLEALARLVRKDENIH
jgi:hypothetical protein